MKNKRVIKFYKVFILQVYGYLALIPFIIALISLLEKNSILDLVFFFTALIFLLTLLLINHLEPIIRIKQDKIIFYNKFNNRPESEMIKDFTTYTQLKRKNLVLKFDNREYIVKLTNRGKNKLLKILKEQS